MFNYKCYTHANKIDTAFSRKTLCITCVTHNKQKIICVNFYVFAIKAGENIILVTCANLKYYCYLDDHVVIDKLSN